jgi:hypothetical protein
MKTPSMRAAVLVASLCLSACGAKEPEPDPEQVKAAAIAARRAEGEAAIRAKRAELREARKPRHLGRKAQAEAFRDDQYGPDKERILREEKRYDDCVTAPLKPGEWADCRIDAPRRGVPIRQQEFEGRNVTPP